MKEKDKETKQGQAKGGTAVSNGAVSRVSNDAVSNVAPANGKSTKAEAPRQAATEAPPIERRKNRRDPNFATPQRVPPPAPRLSDYEPIIGKPELDELWFLARALRGKSVKMVNSTAVGGGVAEILNC